MRQATSKASTESSYKQTLGATKASLSAMVARSEERKHPLEGKWRDAFI